MKKLHLYIIQYVFNGATSKYVYTIEFEVYQWCAVIIIQLRMIIMVVCSICICSIDDGSYT